MPRYPGHSTKLPLLGLPLSVKKPLLVLKSRRDKHLTRRDLTVNPRRRTMLGE
jgi:hypothetical protein